MKYVRKFDEQTKLGFICVSKINYYCGIIIHLRGLRICQFHNFVLELASYNNFLVKEHYACFSILVNSALLLAIDNDTDSITFDKHDPDGCIS